MLLNLKCRNGDRITVSQAEPLLPVQQQLPTAFETGRNDGRGADVAR